MTFKRYSVMVDFGLYPFTLSKYAFINLARHSAHAHNIHFLCFISQQPLVQICPDFLCRLYLKHLSKCAQILCADSLTVIYDVCVSLMAYHLTCHSDKFRSSSSFFLPEFVISTSISFHYSIIMKIIMNINITMKLYE